MNDQPEKIQGVTPTALKIAVTFCVCVIYFIGEIYFWSSEYYVKTPPYFLIVLIAIAASLLVFSFLKKQQPDRTDSKTYALLICIGFALATYALIPRLNIVTDSGGLKDYSYTLDENDVWRSTDGHPAVHVYLPQTKYWQQFKHGDDHTFELRKGGLGIWLVNMDRVYAEQKRFYDCNGLLSCMFTDSIDLGND